jgi:hypothetical protein
MAIRTFRVVSGSDLHLPVALSGHGDDPRWEERAGALANHELAVAIAAQPPLDGELVRYRPRELQRYEAQLVNNPATNTSSDVSRLGLLPAEVLAAYPAVTRSLWVLSYYADPEGQRLLSRNYLRLGSPDALEANETSYAVALRVAPSFPVSEHTVLYAPAGLTQAWLELRLVLARGGQQRLLTTDPTGASLLLLPLSIDPLTGSYASDNAQVVFTELHPLIATNPLAPVLNQPDRPLPPRYQTTTGGGYLPLLLDTAFQPTAPI